MLDNLQVIPPEAFTATGKFGEKLLDKISNAIGWAVIPKNTKKYRLEAEEYLIEQIKKDEKIPALAKAAYISNARKLIKQYVNKCDIYLKAMNDLASDTNRDKEESAENIDDDWLEFFFDKAKDINREDMQIIWAKLLAKEIAKPNSVSKQLLHILSVIDYEEAEAFQKLANFTVFIEETPYTLIFDTLFEAFYNKHGLRQEEIFRLEDIGLLQKAEVGYNLTVTEPSTKLIYFDFEIDLGVSDVVAVGNIALSRAGAELMSIIMDKRRIEEFESIIKHVIGKRMSDLNFDN